MRSLKNMGIWVCPFCDYWCIAPKDTWPECAEHWDVALKLTDEDPRDIIGCKEYHERSEDEH